MPNQGGKAYLEVEVVVDVDELDEDELVLKKNLVSINKEWHHAPR